MRRHLLTVFIFTLGILLLPSRAETQSNVNAPYTGVNLLFVVDQSGSMSGAYTSSGVASDPRNLRFVASQYAVDWLSDFRQTLVVEASTSRPPVNMAVVYFGTAPQPVLDWTAINTDNPAWESTLLEDIRFDLSANRFASDWNLTDTNFNAAFRESEDTLLRAGALPEAGTNPLNAVIVITDGGPCDGGDSRFQFSSNGNTFYNCSQNNAVGVPVQDIQEQRLGILRGFIDSSLPDEDFRYYMVALDAGDEYWATLEDEWEAIICDETDPVPDPAACQALHAVRVETPIEMGTQLNRVLTDIARVLDSPAPLSPCELTPPESACDVPPYVQLMRVNVYKNNDAPLGEQITIQQPNNVNLSPLSPRRANTPIETYVINNPAAGSWNINLSPDASVARVLVDFIPAGVRAAPVTDVQMFEEQTIAVEMVDGGGNVLPVDPTFPVEMAAQVYDATLPDRELRPTVGSPILLTGSNSQFIGTWIPRAAGTYEIRVSAAYQPPDSPAVTLVDDRSVLDNIQVGGTTIDWTQGGISPTNLRADQPVNIRGTALNTGGTGAGNPVGNTAGMQIRITATDRNNPSQSIQSIEPNTVPANANNGLVTTDYLLPPGEYEVIAEVGLPDPATGDFVALSPASPVQFVTVNALVPLTLTLAQPATDTLVAQDFSLNPPSIDWPTTTTVQVQVTDNSNNPVSLAAATANQITLPTLTMNPTRDNVDYTQQLREIRPGVYTVTLPDLPMGNYTFVAQVDSAVTLTGNYTWGQPQVSGEVARILNPLIPLILGAGVAFLIVAVLLGIWWWNRRQRKRQNPLRGTLTLYIQYENGQFLPVGNPLNLEEKEANEQEFRKLRAPYRRIKVSTHNNKVISDAGDLFIDEIEYSDGTVMDRPKRISSQGGPQQIGVSEDGTMAYMVILSDTAGATVSGGLDDLRSSSS